MPEKLTPELQVQFISQFGRVRELFPGPNDFNKYEIESYDPDQGTAHFVDASGRPGQVVSYALLASQQTKTIARRKIHSFGFGQNSSVLSAEVSYTSGSLRTKYELHYDSRSDDNEPNYATISVNYLDQENVTPSEVSLADGSYHEGGKLTRAYISFGDPASLAKYWEEQRRPSGLVLNCFPSLPSVKFEQEEGSTEWVLNDGSFFGREIERIQLGTTASPKEVKPYSYKITPEGQQLAFNRTCTACEGEWNFSLPKEVDLPSLDTILGGEKWVDIIKEFPSTFDMKDGTIIPCPSDVENDSELEEAEEDDSATDPSLDRFPVRRFPPAVFGGTLHEVISSSEDSRNTAERKLPTTSEEVEKMVKEGGLDELPNGLVIFPPGTFS